MATICTACGAGIPQGNQVCAACGAPVAAAAPAQGYQAYTPVAPIPAAAPPPPPPAAPSAWAAQPPAAAPPPPPPPPAAPAAWAAQTPAPVPYAPPLAAPYGNAALAPAQTSSGGSSAVKIILIIVAIFVGLGILAAAGFGFIVWRVSHAIHVSNNGDMQVHAPGGGSFSLNQNKSYSAAELGTDIYPGASAGKGGMKLDVPTGSVVTGIFETSDSKQQVVDFYKAKLGSDATVIDSDASAVISSKRSEKEQIMVTVEANSSQANGKTKFSIMHSKSKT